MRRTCRLFATGIGAAVMASGALHAHPSTSVPTERIELATPEDMRDCEKPHFPWQALHTEKKGEVSVAFLTDLDGKVIEAHERKPSKHKLFNDAAIAGILACQRKPRTINGKPASEWLLVNYKWVIEPDGRRDEPTDAMLSDRRKALEGDLDALYQLAMSYRSEFNDKAQALAMLREAAEHGHPGAVYEMADAMWHGREMSIDQPKALSYYMFAAQKGHAPSQYEIGAAYANGAGVARNEDKAMVWFQKAAEQDHHEAQVALADLLAARANGELDQQAAVNWYRKAAQGGDDLGQRRLAQCYLTGKGVNKDVAQAVMWLQKAVAQRQPKAEAILAVLYLQGEGVPVNHEEALRLLKRSATGGDVGAMILYGDLLAKGQHGVADPAAAADWYRRAADRGDTIAIRRLSVMSTMGSK